MDIDFENLINAQLNNEMIKSDKNMASVIKLLNKYGIFGMKALSFLHELEFVLTDIVDGYGNEE